MQGVTLQQMMQVKVPAGIRPGMGFMVAGPDGSQFQVQCPPDAKEGMMITVAVPMPAVAVAQPMMMAQQPVGFGILRRAGLALLATLVLFAEDAWPRIHQIFAKLHLSRDSSLAANALRLNASA